MSKADKIKCSTYLVITNQAREGQKPRLAITACRKTKPTLERNQVAIKVNLGLPEQYFIENCPVANIEVPEASLIKPDIVIEVPCSEETEDE